MAIFDISIHGMQALCRCHNCEAAGKLFSDTNPKVVFSRLECRRKRDFLIARIMKLYGYSGMTIV